MAAGCGPTGAVVKPDLSKAHAVGLLADLCQSKPFLHLAVPRASGGQQDTGSWLGRSCFPPHFQTCSPSELLTFGPLASSAAHPGVRAGASPASRVVAPATYQICAQSHPLVRSPPSGELRSCGQPCRLSPQPTSMYHQPIYCVSDHLTVCPPQDMFFPLCPGMVLCGFQCLVLLELVAQVKSSYLCSAPSG